MNRIEEFIYISLPSFLSIHPLHIHTYIHTTHHIIRKVSQKKNQQLGKGRRLLASYLTHISHPKSRFFFSGWLYDYRFPITPTYTFYFTHRILTHPPPTKQSPAPRPRPRIDRSFNYPTYLFRYRRNGIDEGLAHKVKWLL